MNWLDSTFPVDSDKTKPGVARGRCDPAAGDPATVEKAHPDASVIYSNIKVRCYLMSVTRQSVVLRLTQFPDWLAELDIHGSMSRMLRRGSIAHSEKLSSTRQQTHHRIRHGFWSDYNYFY